MKMADILLHAPFRRFHITKPVLALLGKNKGESLPCAPVLPFSERSNFLEYQSKGNDPSRTGSYRFRRQHVKEEDIESFTELLLGEYPDVEENPDKVKEAQERFEVYFAPPRFRLHAEYPQNLQRAAMKEQRPGWGVLKVRRKRFRGFVEGIWITIVGTWKSTSIVEEKHRSHLGFGHGDNAEKRHRRRQQTKRKKAEVRMRPRSGVPPED